MICFVLRERIELALAGLARGGRADASVANLQPILNRYDARHLASLRFDELALRFAINVALKDHFAALRGDAHIANGLGPQSRRSRTRDLAQLRTNFRGERLIERLL